MNIAIMGFRGIPANYGGFESFVEELAPRLAKKGHQVTVYCRSNNIKYKDQYYKGVKLVILPTISHKYFDTVCHTFISVVHGSFKKYNVVLMLNAANSPLAFIPRLTGKIVVMNVDGIERLRKKWNLLGKLYYRIGEYLATKLPNAIVSDAKVIEKYYLKTYKKPSVMIPYGAYIEKAGTIEMLSRFGLSPKDYILYVSRLEPENNAHLVIGAFKKVKTNKKLVIVGDAPYATQYIQKLKELANHDGRIIFTGFVYGKGYQELQSQAYCYIQATEVGGTHPALIEAMGFGNCVLVNGTPENIEVVGEAGIVYSKNDEQDLREKLQAVIDDPQIVNSYSQKALVRVEQKYSWQAVVDKYEELFKKLVDDKGKAE